MEEILVVFFFLYESLWETDIMWKLCLTRDSFKADTLVEQSLLSWAGNYQAGAGMVSKQEQHPLFWDQRQRSDQRGPGFPNHCSQRTETGTELTAGLYLKQVAHISLTTCLVVNESELRSHSVIVWYSLFCTCIVLFYSLLSFCTVVTACAFLFRSSLYCVGVCPIPILLFIWRFSNVSRNVYIPNEKTDFHCKRFQVYPSQSNSKLPICQKLVQVI